MKTRSMMATLFGVAVVLTLVSCSSGKATTPEKAFLKFSHWTKLGQPSGMEQFGEKEYANELSNRYDNLALLSEIWPSKPMVVKSEIDGDQAKLYVEGVMMNDQSIQGEFDVVQKDGEWLVSGGHWNWPM